MTTILIQPLRLCEYRHDALDRYNGEDKSIAAVGKSILDQNQALVLP